MTTFTTFLVNGIGGLTKETPWWHGMELPANEQAAKAVETAIFGKKESKPALNLDMDLIAAEIEKRDRVIKTGDRWGFYQ